MSENTVPQEAPETESTAGPSIPELIEEAAGTLYGLAEAVRQGENARAARDLVTLANAAVHLATAVAVKALDRADLVEGLEFAVPAAQASFLANAAGELQIRVGRHIGRVLNAGFFMPRHLRKLGLDNKTIRLWRYIAKLPADRVEAYISHGRRSLDTLAPEQVRHHRWKSTRAQVTP